MPTKTSPTLTPLCSGLAILTEVFCSSPTTGNFFIISGFELFTLADTF
ncbi:MAG: hypothetical protein WCO28_05290 [Bacteroidota bacterium]